MRMSVVPTPSPSKHGPERWTREGEVVTGLVVSADTLRDGPDAVLEAVLHEAAHVLCWVRNVQDTSRRGTYHNASYLAAAVEVGLEWPADRQPAASGRGYGSPELTDDSRTRYATDLKTLAAAIPQVLPHLVLPESTRTRTPDRLTLQCKCVEPRKIRVSQTVAAKGAITCGVCGKDFAAPDATR
jgi:hypothetical protein